MDKKILYNIIGQHSIVRTTTLINWCYKRLGWSEEKLDILLHMLVEEELIREVIGRSGESWFEIYMN